MDQDPKLTVITAEPAGEGIVERLEAMLGLAREGRLSSIAIAAVDREGYVLTRWSKAASMCLLLGGVTRLAHQINGALDEQA